ncbi:MAG TPA: hypothetical protein VIW64_12650 [Pyrinomonadaceae bacterium]|jgi:hypothetical protein
MNENKRTPAQQAVVDKIKEHFGLSVEDADAILFLNQKKPLKPWYPADVAMAIARQSPELRDVEDHYQNYIDALEQVVHSATVTDSKGRTFTSPGVARIGETLPNEEIADEHSLAKARAINGALDMAGFNPVKLDTEVLDLKLERPDNALLDDTAARSKDLRQIHAIAWEKGLIKPSGSDDPAAVDASGYFNFLATNFNGATTAGGLKPVERAQVINLLRELPDAAAASAA